MLSKKLQTKKTVYKHSKHTNSTAKASTNFSTITKTHSVEYCGVCRDKVKVSNITFVDLKGKNGAIRKRMVYMCEKHGHKWGKFIAGTHKKSDKSLMTGGASNKGIATSSSIYSVSDVHKNNYFLYSVQDLINGTTLILSFSIDSTTVTQEGNNKKVTSVDKITFYLKLPPFYRTQGSKQVIIELFNPLPNISFIHDIYYISLDDGDKYTKDEISKNVFCKIDIPVDSNIGKYITGNNKNTTFTLCAQIVAQTQKLKQQIHIQENIYENMPQENIYENIPHNTFTDFGDSIINIKKVTKLDTIVFIKAQEEVFIKSGVLPPPKNKSCKYVYTL